MANKPIKQNVEQKPKQVHYDALVEIKKMIKEGKHPETVIKYIDSFLKN